MAEEHLFRAEMDRPVAAGEPSRPKRSCLTGCLVVFVILLVIAIIIGVWIARNMRDWTAAGVTEVIRQGMISSQLPAEEQREIMVQVDRVATAFRDKRITLEQLSLLAQRFAQSPLMSLIGASMIEQHYFAKSGLSAEERTAGSQTLQRFIRGAVDQKIGEAGVDAAMAHVADRDAGGDWQLRQTLTDEQLRAFLAEAKQQADAAGIPDQPAAVDPSEEVRKMVDETLAAGANVGGG